MSRTIHEFSLSKLFFLSGALMATSLLGCQASPEGGENRAVMRQALTTPVFINELHYDNTGTDAGEAIEVAGPAGTDLSGYSLVLYNGNGGAPYHTQVLSGSLPDQNNGFGTIAVTYAVNGIQTARPTAWRWCAPTLAWCSS